MKLPIIMAAFGTTSKAIDTYTHLDNKIRSYFPTEEIIWTYTSRRITRELQERKGSMAVHPEEVLRQLANRGVKRAILQSLHLFPGTEFHSLHQLAQEAPLDCRTGKPILTSFQDYEEIGEILRPIISKRQDKTILILGHGTDHPIWTAYYTLEKILRRKLGPKIYVGVVEKYPDSGHLIEEIAASGIKEVCIIPLFLVAGMHYRRDIISDRNSSWESRLRKENIDVESIDYGLGLLPGFSKIITRHIVEARDAMTSRS